MIFFASLNSGSNGNCYYVGTATDGILVDVGISCREVEKRMKRLGLPIENLRAVFVSHEHTDHISGIERLSAKFNLPVYITAKTFGYSKLGIAKERVHGFLTGQAININGLSIVPFLKKHDAVDPHSFVVSYKGIHIGVFTDIGINCAEVIRYFKQCHAVFLESNYCADMLDKGSYPFHLKERIRNGYGHLSNTQALKLFCDHRGPLSHLILSHLSQNNNDPELVDRLFRQHAGDTRIIVASRREPTALFKIDSAGIAQQLVSLTALPINDTPVQLSLFGM